MTQTLPTFEVDKEGLARVVGRKGKGFVLTELVQNAWDEDSAHVDVALRWLEEPGKTAGGTETGGLGLAELVVEDDDPDGFTDIGHAYTLFAESEKKADAEKRGRFNIGEKYVVAVCEMAVIDTTTGCVLFEHGGRRMLPPSREHGSRFVGQLRLTQAEFDEIVATASRLIPPKGVATTFNGEALEQREPVRTFEDKFWTEFGPDLKRTIRKCEARLYEPAADEAAMIYELGIPVVETGDRFHVDIQQKVPLNVERDNVTPAFLRDVRRITLNHAHDLLAQEDGAETWLTDAMQDEEVDPQALGAAIKLRFGDHVVSRDPSDPEANGIAHSEGYTVLSSGSLPKATWGLVREHKLVLPAGQVTPSPKPYPEGGQSSRKTEPAERWTDGMRRVADFAHDLGQHILGADVVVAFVNDPEYVSFNATYGAGKNLDGTAAGLLEFNLRTLGRRWFDLADPADPKVIDLLLHEFAHHHSGDHLSRDYHDAITHLAGRTVRLALDRPDVFTAHAVDPA